MTRPRKDVVKEGEDFVYHCITRCVRRCFLCGEDILTRKNYDHRKKWVQERLKNLSYIFCIDILNFSVMSNHLHIMLKVNHRKLEKLSNEEVAIRWRKLYPKSCELKAEEIEILLMDKEKMRELRKRLTNISWFMKSISEYIARRANKEDDCTGRFWEGRFACKRICDEASMLQCALYIDLNPIRAGISIVPEKSIFTSAYERIKSFRAKEKLKEKESLRKFKIESLKLESKRDSWLLSIEKSKGGVFSISLAEYLKLLDFAGRELKAEKRGKIPSNLEPIFDRLKIEKEDWIENLEKVNKGFSLFMANKDTIKVQALNIGQKWARGVMLATKMFC